MPSGDPFPVLPTPGLNTVATGGEGRGTHRRARLVGVAAHGLLVRAATFSGRVAAAVTGAVYLEGRGGEILWIAPPGSPAHARAAIASLPPGIARTGMAAASESGILRIGPAVLDLNAAVVWDPCTLRPREAAPPARVHAQARRALQGLASRAGADSFGRITPLFIDGADGGLGFTQEIPPHVGMALPVLAALRRACLALDAEAVARQGEELIGLGPGLTPAGDDFLGGLLFAAHHLMLTYPARIRWDARPLLDLTQKACARTNPISRAILGDLILGRGPEPLHSFFARLLGGKAANPDGGAAARLARIGHTTGRDMMTGALAGALLLTGAALGRGAPCEHSGR
ncbi:MAG: DUF2877 domain-containing protein [Patescibacteria group bacterium]